VNELRTFRAKLLVKVLQKTRMLFEYFHLLQHNSLMDSDVNQAELRPH
jgi:hypothetical protein